MQFIATTFLLRKDKIAIISDRRLLVFKFAVLASACAVAFGALIIAATVCHNA